MDPISSDPNNRAPEVRPGDDWDDEPGDPEGIRTGGTWLPPRRIQASVEVSRSPVSEAPPEGLRIGSAAPRPKSIAGASPIDVAVIGGGVPKLVPIERPSRVAAAGTFKEAVRVDPVGSPGPQTRPVQGRIPLKALFAVGGCVVLLVLTGLWALPAINRKYLSKLDAGEKWVIEQRAESTAMDALAARASEAMEMFRLYAVARTVDPILPLLAYRETLDESLVRARHRPLDVEPGWSPSLDSTWSVIDEDGRCHALLEGLLPDGMAFAAFFVVEDGDRLRMDWKATTGYGSADFSELARGVGDASEVRVVLSPGEYYNASYPEERFDAYRLSAPGGEQRLWGYVAKEAALAGELKRLFPESIILEGGPSPRRLTLVLRRGVADAAPGQWEIGEMLHKDWLMR